MSNVHAVISHAADGGFPSHHAAFMAAVATAVYLRNRQAGNGLMWLTVICGIARIAAGIHYPTDIIFGITLGILVTVGTNRLLMRVLSIS
jgi:undecaprenyl-diphosphatase